jgi:hypothetical protein
MEFSCLVVFQLFLQLFHQFANKMSSAGLAGVRQTSSPVTDADFGPLASGKTFLLRHLILSSHFLHHPLESPPFFSALFPKQK